MTIFDAPTLVAASGQRITPEELLRPDVTVVPIERVRALLDPDPGLMPLVPDWPSK